jgi:hypothetical protein
MILNRAGRGSSDHNAGRPEEAPPLGQPCGGAFFLGLALSEPRTPPGRNGPGGVPYGAGRRSLIRRQVKDKLVLFTRLCIESHTPSTGIHGPPRVQTPYSQLGEALSKREWQDL